MKPWIERRFEYRSSSKEHRVVVHTIASEAIVLKTDFAEAMFRHALLDVIAVGALHALDRADSLRSGHVTSGRLRRAYFYACNSAKERLRHPPRRLPYVNRDEDCKSRRCKPRVGCVPLRGNAAARSVDAGVRSSARDEIAVD